MPDQHMTWHLFLQTIEGLRSWMVDEDNPFKPYCGIEYAWSGLIATEAVGSRY